jgi:hypothetical protein
MIAEKNNLGFGACKIYDGKGNLKRIISAKDVWKKIWEIEKPTASTKNIKGKWREMGQTKKKEPRELREVICPLCGKKAFRKSKRAIYCSDECTIKSMNKRAIARRKRVRLEGLKNK